MRKLPPLASLVLACVLPVSALKKVAPQKRALQYVGEATAVSICGLGVLALPGITHVATHQASIDAAVAAGGDSHHHLTGLAPMAQEYV
jgi:hypothetical protein